MIPRQAVNYTSWNSRHGRRLGTNAGQFQRGSTDSCRQSVPRSPGRSSRMAVVESIPGPALGPTGRLCCAPKYTKVCGQSRNSDPETQVLQILASQVSWSRISRTANPVAHEKNAEEALVGEVGVREKLREKLQRESPTATDLLQLLVERVKWLEIHQKNRVLLPRGLAPRKEVQRKDI